MQPSKKRKLASEESKDLSAFGREDLDSEISRLVAFSVRLLNTIQQQGTDIDPLRLLEHAGGGSLPRLSAAFERQRHSVPHIHHLPRDCSNVVLGFLYTAEACVLGRICRGFHETIKYHLLHRRVVRYCYGVTYPTKDLSQLQTTCRADWFMRMRSLCPNVKVYCFPEPLADAMKELWEDAVDTCHFEVLSALMDAFNNAVDPNVDAGNKTALWLAAAHNNVDVTHKLLAHPNLDVNYICYGYRTDDPRRHSVLNTMLGEVKTTSLAVAAMYGCTDVVRLLLNDERCDVNACTSNLSDERSPGKVHTAIHVAAQYGHTDVIEAMLACSRVDADVHDWMGRTAMHYNLCQLHEVHCVAILKLFLSSGRVNVRAHHAEHLGRGITYLHYIAAYGRREKTQSAEKTAVARQCFDILLGLEKDGKAILLNNDIGVPVRLVFLNTDNPDQHMLEVLNKHETYDFSRVDYPRCRQLSMCLHYAVPGALARAVQMSKIHWYPSS